MKKIRVLEILLIAFLVGTLIGQAFAHRYTRLYTTGTSMLPNVEDGQWVWCKYVDDYNVGDAVVYRINGYGILHRIMEINTVKMGDMNIDFYYMKGDNNDNYDMFPIFKENIICKVDV